MIITQYPATTMLNAGLSLYNGGSLAFYEGEIPASPESGPSGGSTLLATFSFASPAFAAPTFLTTFGMTAQASFIANSVTPAAAGTACYAMARTSGGSYLEQRTVGTEWQASLAVVLYQFIFANSNTYICVSAGTTASSGLGPSGTGSVIADGTAVWKWFAAGAPDIQVTDPVLSTGTPFSVPQYWLALPCL